MLLDRVSRRAFLTAGGKALLFFMYGSDILMKCFQEVEIKISDVREADYFKVIQGQDINLMYQGDKICAHIVLSSKGKNRIITSFTNGNSCFGLWFDRDSDMVIEPDDKMEEVITKEGVTFISFGVKTNKKNLIIDDFIADSVRAARDKGDCDDYNSKNRVLWRKKFAETCHNITIAPTWIEPSVNILKLKDGKSVIKFYRTTIDKTYGVYGEVTFPSCITVSKEENGKITLTCDRNIDFLVRTTSTFPSLTPFKPEELINKDFLSKIKNNDVPECNDRELYSALEEYRKYFRPSLRDLLFLSYKECYLAGSWRFLTYFGRDTMMTSIILGEVLSKSAYESAMESILERLAHDGDVAHEDNSFWQAEGERICEYNNLMKEHKKGESSEILKNLYKENYDYKMVDDDFIFPIMVHNYLKRHDGTDDFINRTVFSSVLNKETDNKKNIMTNFNKVITSAIPYYETWKQLSSREKETVAGNKALAEKLIRIKEGMNAGDWRDSDKGLGGGVYSGNVNIYLVPASLKAIYTILKREYSKELKDIAEKNNLTSLLHILNSFSGEEKKSREMEKLIDCWSQARKHFKVSLSCDEIKKRLKFFIEENNLLSDYDRNIIKELPVTVDCKIKDFIEGQKPDILKEGMEFYGISLDSECKPVEVMNSDTGFGFLLDEMDIKEMEEAVKIASLTYPLGLMTAGGLLTANPSVSEDRNLWKSLTVTSYHGTVIWSWQMTMMEKGLLYQAKKTASINKELSDQMIYLATELIKIENAIGEMRNFELWTIKGEKDKFIAVPYGEGSETESNAVQLWSTVALSLLNPFNVP
ncbi:MAG: hypothetical protein ABRQ38_16065 [Candidatus Eremiobacterota bacterium]